MELTKLLFLSQIYCHCHYYQRVTILTTADCYHHHHHHHHHHHYEYIISLLLLLNLVPVNYTPRRALRLKQMLVYPLALRILAKTYLRRKSNIRRIPKAKIDHLMCSLVCFLVVIVVFVFVLFCSNCCCFFFQ